MQNAYFQHQELLKPPVSRAAYSDRTAWLMGEMSRLAYRKYENDLEEIKPFLKPANFELVEIFNNKGTQGFLAKRESDKMAVLAFRGTEPKDLRDVVTDLKAKFYQDEKGTKIHRGFHQAFQAVAEPVRQAVAQVDGYALYITGHSLGGALALLATRELNLDQIAACYTFGSPKVGTEEFDDDIKAPIYRVVNSFDLVPSVPPSYLFDLLNLFPWKWMKSFVKKFHGYAQPGDMRFLTPAADIRDVEVISNYNEFSRLFGMFRNKKRAPSDHDSVKYAEKLARWALKRKNK